MSKESTTLIFDRLVGLDSIPTAPLPDLLLGDQIRLKQILINLVKNALKFTLKGFVKIIAAYDEDMETLEIHVIDNGKGIKAEEMSSLFKKFGKLRRTAT